MNNASRRQTGEICGNEIETSGNHAKLMTALHVFLIQPYKKYEM